MTLQQTFTHHYTAEVPLFTKITTSETGLYNSVGSSGHFAGTGEERGDVSVL